MSIDRLKVPAWLMRTAIAVLFVALAPAPVSAKTCTLEALQAWLEPGAKEIDLSKTHLLRNKKRKYAFRYEEELARQSGLSLEEVMGVTRNFHHEPVVDGSTGLIQQGKELALDPDTNLLDAYKAGMSKIRPGELRAEDIFDLRMRALRKLSVSDGKKQVEVPFRYRERASAWVEEEIHPEVRKKLLETGCKLEEPATGGARIHYSAADEKGTHEALNRLTTSLNQMVRDRYPPEYIVASAVQDLLILHPFKDGNGRTARLLGQILYKKLTGNTVFFPRTFYEELSYSRTTLAKSLFSGEPLKYPSYHSRDAVITDTFNRYEILPEEWKVPPAHASIKDVSFGDFLYQGDKYRYDDLLNAAEMEIHFDDVEDIPFDWVKAAIDEERLTPLPGSGVKSRRGKEIRYRVKVNVPVKGREEFVFYGRPAASAVETDKILTNMFVYGRNSRGAAHRNITAHLDSTKNVASGFFQATASPDKTKQFSHRGANRYAIDFIIDPAGADTLSVPGLGAATKKNALIDEEEILFDSVLSPDRVVGAWVTDRNLRQKRLVLNPNYRKSH